MQWPEIKEPRSQKNRVLQHIYENSCRNHSISDNPNRCICTLITSLTVMYIYIIMELYAGTEEGSYCYSPNITENNSEKGENTITVKSI